MIADGFDLNDYLRRLSYDGPRQPSLSVLAAIISAHTAAIPYENIDVLLQRGATLDIGPLQQKLVQSQRGGYCFEQNTLLAGALAALGFTVTRLAGRVIRGRPISTEAGRGHKLLRIDLLEGPYIVDVGFGSLTPTAPLALKVEEIQATPHEAFRLMPFDREFVLEARLGDVWDSLYRFVTEPALLIDFQMSNWFTSTFPSSAFRNNLIVARPTASGRMTLFNRRFTIRDRNNQTVRRVLEGIDDYRDVLLGEFGLMLDKAELAAVAEAMASHGPDEAIHPAFVSDFSFHHLCESVSERTH